MDKTCFLIGFMGSGKTYQGIRLAKCLGVPFVDLDEHIEINERRTIAMIFEQQGEAAFRRIERRYLHELEHYAPCVVATGGGTPCFFDNMDWMNAHGTTIFLKTPMAVLVARLRADPGARPLLAGVPEDQLVNHIAHLLEQRAPYYSMAKVVVEGVDLVRVGEMERLLA